MGEFDLIARFFKRHPPPSDVDSNAHGIIQGIGDDCAVWMPTPGTQLCISSDMLVEGRHFLSTVSPESLGHKALAVNLSDLAACGAVPRAFTLALALPSVDEAWLEGFSRGLFALADLHGCKLIGGDTTKGPLNICITVFGEVPPGTALLRSGAKAGDDLYVSGGVNRDGQPEYVGQARLALEVFRGQIEVAQAVFKTARHRMERPSPRVQLGHALRGVATSAIDVSDGLLGDLSHILHASQVGCSVQTAWVADLGLPSAQSLALALSGGDDYELLFTAPVSKRDAVQAAAKASGCTVTGIGQITTERGLRVLDKNAEPIAQTFASFDHFAPSN